MHIPAFRDRLLYDRINRDNLHSLVGDDSNQHGALLDVSERDHTNRELLPELTPLEPKDPSRNSPV